MKRIRPFVTLPICALLIPVMLLGGCGGGGGSSSGTGGTDGNGGTNGSSVPGTATGGNAPDSPLVEPADPDAPSGTTPPATAASRLDPADVEASRLLMQATFGPTPASIAEFRTYADPEAWIDAQLALPASATEPYTRANSNGSNTAARHEAWWNNALAGPDQLRQRVAFALSQIFVVSDVDYALANAQYGMADYYDMLSENAFSDYRSLLERVTLHPAMGVYLSMVQNEKANPAENVRPDENFAREVLQLFSIGLDELDASGEPVLDGATGAARPAYDQRTVEEFARVFTGWDYANVRRWGDTNITGEQYTLPMMPNDAFHDGDAKSLLNGAVAPAGLSAREDLGVALDNIAAHPNVGPFISKQLIQRLVTGDPSPGYVARVAAVWDGAGAGGARGDLGAVVKAILLDGEARTAGGGDPDFGKLREPVVRFAHFWRALDASTGPESGGVHATADFPMSRMDEMTGQAVMSSPSVFNFYLPDNPVIAGGTRLSPEMQIMSEANLAATHNNYHHHVYRFTTRADLSDDNPRVTLIDLEPLVAFADDEARLLDWYNLVFFAGNMPDAMRDTLGTYLGTLGEDDAGRFARVQDTLFAVLASPAFHVQR